jgi:hypothetical protein
MWPYFNIPLEGHIRQVWLYNFMIQMQNQI